MSRITDALKDSLLTSKHPPQKIIVIHHRDSDGYCAALAVYKTIPYVRVDGDLVQASVEYIDVQYGEPFPDITLDKNTFVYILDFSYDRVTLDYVHSQVRELKVIDHHKTAKAQLEGAPYAIYDMTKSGSTLAWEHFHGYAPTSTLHMLVEDYDINWPQKHKESRWLENALLANPRCSSLQYWAKLLDDPVELQQNIEIGKGIAFGNESIVRSIIEKKSYQEFQFGGYRGVILNSTILRNEIAEGLLNALPDIEFAVTYRTLSKGQLRLSFRARESDEHVDVSKLAQSLGVGGGHKSAAGVVVSQERGFHFLRACYAK